MTTPPPVGQSVASRSYREGWWWGRFHLPGVAVRIREGFEFNSWSDGFAAGVAERLAARGIEIIHPDGVAPT